MKTHNIQNCGKCGLCLSVCPVYAQIKQEQVSPRAKLHLIKAFRNKNIESSALLKDIMSKCLMCGSCTAACPSGIDHFAWFMDMRSDMKKSQGQSPAIKSLIHLLGREYRIRFSAGLAKAGRKVIPDRFADSYKLGSIPIRKFPRFNEIPLRRSAGSCISPNGKKQGKLVYFTGCATNYLYEDTGNAVIGVLKHMGYEIIIPEGQTCCSIPILFHGAPDKAFKNIRANIKALAIEDAEAVIVDCPTCGYALEHEYPRFMENNSLDSEPACTIASKTVHILNFIDKHFNLLEFNKKFTRKIRISYHAPCHTKNNNQAHLRIERLLKKLEFADYRPTSDADVCCGGGGTFFYEFASISHKMAMEKIKNAKAVNPRFWLTDCPVCRMNLAGTMDDDKGCPELTHPVSFIYSGLKQK